jgi:hypothetical protein
MTQALIVQCIQLRSIILMTQNNPAPCSVGHIPEHLWSDTIKSTSHCLFKVISSLVALLCNDILHIFAGVDIVIVLYLIFNLLSAVSECLF